MGYGKLNFNIELLQTKCSDSKEIQNLLCQLFFCRCVRFKFIQVLMKWDVINKTALKRFENGNFQIVVSLLYAH